MKKLLLLCCLGLFASGCTLYFGEDDDDRYYSYCDSTGCWTCDSETGECWSEGGGGLSCYSDYDCASGCYCDESYGSCVETGFCTYDTDCGPGYTCDDRASCVPDGTTYCWDTGCPWGYYCDSFGGGCVPTTTCSNDAECGTGYACIGGSCTPVGCTSDASCAAGCYCDEASGGCVESGYCSTDSECPSGEECDESRSTCIPDTTPPTCEELTDEASCDANEACIPIYQGNNCTDPNGATCTSGSMNCTCESFTFAACVTAAPPA